MPHINRFAQLTTDAKSRIREVSPAERPCFLNPE
jgi:hypothetical protein